MFFKNIGHPLGKWSNDKCLNAFNVTREEAMNIDQIMACCMGVRFDPNHYTIFQNIFIQYKILSEGLYPGSWSDHRHDQTVMSFLINKHKLNILEGHKSFFIYEHFKTVPEFQPISKSVCLISR